MRDVLKRSLGTRLINRIVDTDRKQIRQVTPEKRGVVY